MSDTKNYSVVKKLNEKNKVILPNFVLIFSFFYFLVVLCEDCSTISRKLFYIGLLILDSIILIYINRVILYPVSGILNNINTVIEGLCTGKKKVEEQDSIKKFIEESVRKPREDINYLNYTLQKPMQELYSPIGGVQKEYKLPFSLDVKDFMQPQFSNIKSINEKEILNSATKFDDRFFSAKSFPFQSGVKSNFMIGSGTENIGMQFYNRPQSGQIYSQINPQNYSYMLLKNLELTGKFLPKLKIGNESIKEDVERDADLLNVTEYTDMWIKNYKKFLSDTLIFDFLYEHRDNIAHLNKFLMPFLNIQIVEEVVDDTERTGEIFRSELAYLIKNSNFGVTSLGGKMGQVQNLSQNIESSNINRFQILRKNEENKKYYQIFFGDNSTLVFILNRVDEKLRNFQNQRERAKFQKEIEDYNTFVGENLEKTIFSKPITGEMLSSNVLTYTDRYTQISQKKSLDDKGDINGLFSNPLLNKNKYDKIESYSDLLITHNKTLEDSLKLLKSFIENRMRINDLIYPEFLKEINYNHKQIIMEYAIYQLENLKKTNFQIYKNDSGTMFKNEAWFSALPSDSQLLSSIFIKYLEETFQYNNSIKSLLTNFPFTPKSDKNPTNLTFIQINPPGVQPHFNVFWQDKIYYCHSGKENFFYSSVILLSIMKMNLLHEIKKLKIDSFINTIINY